MREQTKGPHGPERPPHPTSRSVVERAPPAKGLFCAYGEARNYGILWLVRHIPIVDASDHTLTTSGGIAADSAVTRPGLFDPQQNRATMFATLAVTFLWFSVALALMWLAASFGTGSVSNTYVLLALAFTIVSLALFAAAVGAGGPPRTPASGGLVFVATLFSVFIVAWFGALVEVRWLVVPVSYGVGIALTRHFRQLPVPVAVALRSDSQGS